MAHVAVLHAPLRLIVVVARRDASSSVPNHDAHGASGASEHPAIPMPSRHNRLPPSLHSSHPHEFRIYNFAENFALFVGVSLGFEGFGWR
ncbi:hypothetical protein GUJ93_ZPchr0002g22941 [Zizania palustris]|uniref:Uncharacterized protein n=1 Tax=Zizania palustris TaxID=103762 RepID=A0A8J5SPB2_ZIZPA|nr:hypothetical protein GUJ93_ZPchr0002g22941 [Zizania palustris]